MSTERYLSQYIAEDLKSKMVFVGGPRQVVKTTLALNYLPTRSVSDPGYLNWDVPAIRRSLAEGDLPRSPICILDEIHKYKQWRNLVKGNKDYGYEDIDCRVLPFIKFCQETDMI